VQVFFLERIGPGNVDPWLPGPPVPPREKKLTPQTPAPTLILRRSRFPRKTPKGPLPLGLYSGSSARWFDPQDRHGVDRRKYNDGNDVG